MSAAMRAAAPQLSVRRLCQLAGVGRTWYYTRPSPDEAAARDAALRDAIERLVLAFPGYGYRLWPRHSSARGGRLTTSASCG